METCLLEVFEVLSEYDEARAYATTIDSKPTHPLCAKR